MLKKGYLEPLRKVRPDWPVIEVPGADHITCVLHAKFRDEIANWLAKQAKNKDYARRKGLPRIQERCFGP